MGATRPLIDQVVAQGFESWLDDQFAMPRATSHWDWMIADGYGTANSRGAVWGWDNSAWRQLISEPDQLRQRVGSALLDFLVVGVDGLNIHWPGMALGAYMDVLLDNAFGNYRQILGAITFNPAMASFLTFLWGRKANPQTGAMPDENYARELLQLFTIGLYQLNPDGSLKLANGQPIETYTTDDVVGLARVFTGLRLATTDTTTCDRMRMPLIVDEALHEQAPSSFLGTTVSGPGVPAINAALDWIFTHPNVPPFVGRNLIQRLTTSNPSPGYIARVAQAFVDNGEGVRGDMQAVIRAILLHPEARGPEALASPAARRLREPVLRFVNWARAFDAKATQGKWGIGNTSAPQKRLGHSQGRARSVFGWFRPGYTPPNTAVSAAGLVAPEFQLANEQTVIGFLNFIYSAVASAIGDVKADYSSILPKAQDAAELADEINLLLAAGQLPPATLSEIRAAVESVSLARSDGAINRIGISIMLTLASPDYLVIR